MVEKSSESRGEGEQLLASGILFAASIYYYTCYSRSRCSSFDDSDEDDDDSIFIRNRSRLLNHHHRLSFHDCLANEGEASVAFPDSPKNRNWNHFDISQNSSNDLSRSGTLEGDLELFPLSKTAAAAQTSQDLLTRTDDSSGGGGDNDDEVEDPLSPGDFLWTQGQSPEPKHPERIQSKSTTGLNRTPKRSVSFDDPRRASLWRRFEGWVSGQHPKPRLHPTRCVSHNEAEDDLTKTVKVQNRLARQTYNARIMPSKLILMRHGQSMGNIDEKLYSTTPDNAMPLTKLGFEQAREAGHLLRKQILKDHRKVHFIVSPYVRAVETFHGIASAWCDPSEFDHLLDREQRVKAWYQRLMELGLTWHEDPRIREQDFGNYQDPVKIKLAKKDRFRFGTFYYRFPHGESASDVFDRISTFLDSLWRSFDMNTSDCYVIVTHGIAVRVLLARYFRYTVDQFHLLANPRNCEMILLNHNGKGKLQLGGRYEMESEVNPQDVGDAKLLGYKYHKRLKVLPKTAVRKPTIRVSYDDK